MLEIALAAVSLLGVAWLGGELAARLRWPRALGEVLGGALLGVHGLGVVAPELQRELLAAPGLDLVIETSLALTMFFAGFDAAADLARPQLRRVLWIAVAGVLLAFGSAGFMAVIWPGGVAPYLGPRAVEGAASGWFLAAAIAITSLPILHRLLSQAGLLTSEPGRMALGVAVVGNLPLLSLVEVVAPAGPMSPWLRFGPFGIAAAAALVALVARSPHAARGLLALTLGALPALVGLSPFLSALIAGAALRRLRPAAEADVLVLQARIGPFVLPLAFAALGAKISFEAGFDALPVAALVAAALLLKALTLTFAARTAGVRGPALLVIVGGASARGGSGLALATLGFQAGHLSSSGAAAIVLLVLVSTLTAAIAFAATTRRLQKDLAGLGAAANDAGSLRP